MVVKVISPILLKIADRKKTYILHHDRLKPCLDRDIPLWLRRKRSNLLQGSGEFQGEPDTEPLYLDKLFEESSVANDRSVNDHVSMDDSIKTNEILPETPDSSLDNACFSEPLPSTRTGRERRKPKYLVDYEI